MIRVSHLLYGMMNTGVLAPYDCHRLVDLLGKQAEMVLRPDVSDEFDDALMSIGIVAGMNAIDHHPICTTVHAIRAVTRASGLHIAAVRVRQIMAQVGDIYDE